MQVVFFSSGSKKSEGTLFTTAPSAQMLKLDSMARLSKDCQLHLQSPETSTSDIDIYDAPL